MTKKQILSEDITIPENVAITINNRMVKVKGQKGELERELFHPQVKITQEDNKILFTTMKKSKLDKKMMYTCRAHLNNMIKGVQEGFTCKLKICSGHFPMNVSVANHEFVIKNFIGEKVPRKLKLDPKITVSVQGEEIIIQGIDRELVGQTAGSIEKITRRSSFDRRIFQQGIYITEKP